MLLSLEYGAPPKKRTVVRTLRIDEDVDEALCQEANRQEVSINVMANRALRKWADFDSFVARYNALGISSQIFASIIDEVPKERLLAIGEMTGAKLPRMLFDLVGRPTNCKTVTNYFFKQVLSKYDRWYEYESHMKGGSEKFVVRHNFGLKWSFFLKGYIEATMKSCLTIDTNVEIVGTTILIFTVEPVAYSARGGQESK